MDEEYMNPINLHRSENKEAKGITQKDGLKQRT